MTSIAVKNHWRAPFFFTLYRERSFPFRTSTCAHTRRTVTADSPHICATASMSDSDTGVGPDVRPPLPRSLPSSFFLTRHDDYDFSFAPPPRTATAARRRRARTRHSLTHHRASFLPCTHTQGLALYERQRAERIARNDEMMLRLGLPALGSKLRLPTTPAAGGAGGSKNPNSFKPVKRRNPKEKSTLPDPNFDMVLRVRKAVDYTDVADVPKPGPPKFPRVEPANAQLSGAAATGPATTLDTLDSKYEKDPEARKRAIRLDVRRKPVPRCPTFFSNRIAGVGAQLCVFARDATLAAQI